MSSILSNICSFYRRFLSIALPVAAFGAVTLHSGNDDAALLVESNICAMERLSGAPIGLIGDQSSIPDLSANAELEQRKTAFLALLLPMIQRANDEIGEDRRLVEQAMSCLKRGLLLDLALQTRLNELHQDYDTGGNIDDLYVRLDIVPPSLILAQGAVESGWGTAKVALDANALFGQISGDVKPAPKNAKPAPHKLASFDDVEDSLCAYLRNLNTHGAYRSFRVKREELRKNGEVLQGLALADTLIAYSERKDAYIKQLKTVIRQNNFEAFDLADSVLPGTTVLADSVRTYR
jgi:Bax protein